MSWPEQAPQQLPFWNRCGLGAVIFKPITDSARFPKPVKAPRLLRSAWKVGVALDCVLRHAQTSSSSCTWPTGTDTPNLTLELLR